MVILQGLELGFTVGPVLFPVLQIIKLGGILCANRSTFNDGANFTCVYAFGKCHKQPSTYRQK